MAGWKIFARIVKAIFIGLGIITCLGWVVFYIWLETATDKEEVLGVSEFKAEIYQPIPTPGSDLDMIAGNAEIQIPSSARDIHGSTDGFQEIDTHVRLDLPAKELDHFIKNTRCTEPLSVVALEDYTQVYSHLRWWTSDRATCLKQCSGLHENLSQFILVDCTDTDMVRIYVFSMVGNFPGNITVTPGP